VIEMPIGFVAVMAVLSLVGLIVLLLVAWAFFQSWRAGRGDA
jgi:hypothetical protein